ncbi:MAG TPA: PEPxxWA-CTERM sorting domain-containing protein, partial [Caulobacteraceae bacterium]|nr:PEPxxWA-CTERM sorting domain-containing protein [Caulobacteraceae bacterium]
AADGSGPPGYASDAHATLTYWAEVVGPDNVTVPLGFEARLSAFGGEGPSVTDSILENFFATAYLSAGSLFDQVTFTGDAASPKCPDCLGESQLFNQSLTVDSNIPFEISMAAYVGAENNANAVAYADPYMFIEPDFSALNPGYSLVFSPNVVDALPAGIPEPATWAMMLFGVGVIGGGLRIARRESGMALTAA